MPPCLAPCGDVLHLCLSPQLVFTSAQLCFLCMPEWPAGLAGFWLLLQHLLTFHVTWPAWDCCAESFSWLSAGL